MNRKGITLIELLVVLAILGIVLAMIYRSYIVVLKSQIQQSGIAQSNINNLIGLEMLRKDIEMAGFGLPWNISVSYNEADYDSKYTPDPHDLNAEDSSKPEAFSFANNAGPDNSDVLVIRSSVAALNKYTEHWGYVYENLSDEVYYKALGGDGNIDDIYFAVVKPENMEFLKYVTDSDFGTTCKPGGNIYLFFGIDDNNPRMPFNRVDYYLKRPTDGMPKRCAPNTYELYRATIRQSDGKRNEQPIMDCVVKFQVKFGLDNNSDGSIDDWSDAPYDNSVANSDISKEIREQLKQVKVFIVYQEGKKDPDFTFNQSFKLRDDTTDTSDEFTPTGDQKHYRWKMVELVVDPLNIKVRKRNLE
ncbi:PilW family protein [Hippea sp. KM1]|uniref:PilW family protein n=1 Tax=Hippea sp. KM1 TaxID=944481 RepID=UPI00046D7192|nr:PilW family protein [Hippea sp. KM1]